MKISKNNQHKITNFCVIQFPHVLNKKIKEKLENGGKHCWDNFRDCLLPNHIGHWCLGREEKKQREQCEQGRRRDGGR